MVTPPILAIVPFSGVMTPAMALARILATMHDANGHITIPGFYDKVRDWGDVPGSGLTGPIDLTVRTAASGTQDAFQKIFMGSKSVSSSASAKASNGLIQQTVQSDENAIGYVSLDFISGTNAAAYNGVACNLRNAKSGEYGGVRNFWMVTRGRAKGLVQKFISWVQNSTKANKIVGTHWVPLHD